jgi:S1-C subfamily serine protease
MVKYHGHFALFILALASSCVTPTSNSSPYVGQTTVEPQKGEDCLRTDGKIIHASVDYCLDIGGTPQSISGHLGKPVPVKLRNKELKSTGTGYSISKSGYFVTNRHVVLGCSYFDIRRGNSAVEAKVVEIDKLNDIAVIEGNLSGITPLSFRVGKSIRPGEAIAAIGFPLSGILASSSQISTGTVMSLSGIGDDSRFLQISAPIQPGNSGGPLLDMSGNIAGTVVSTLSPLVTAKAGGVLPQNVNFAIKSSAVTDFLDSKRIKYQTANSIAKLEPADIGDIGAKSVVIVECYK